MRKMIGLFLAVALVSCKARQTAVRETKANIKSEVETDTIIARHYSSVADFSTLSIRARAHYEDAHNEQNVTAEIKMQKDRKILISIRVLGITMAKALVTPDRVQYYSKLDGSYFDGDFTMLTKWLGTPLDFTKVQNLLIGAALEDLTKGNYEFAVDDKRFKLSASDGDIFKAFWFEAGKGLLKSENIVQPALQRSVEVDYPGYSDYQAGALPSSIAIAAKQEKGTTHIDIEYNQATFNETLSFPYSVPDGYERIFID